MHHECNCTRPVPARLGLVVHPPRPPTPPPSALPPLVLQAPSWAALATALLTRLHESPCATTPLAVEVAEEPSPPATPCAESDHATEQQGSQADGGDVRDDAATPMEAGRLPVDWIVGLFPFRRPTRISVQMARPRAPRGGPLPDSAKPPNALSKTPTACQRTPTGRSMPRHASHRVEEEEASLAVVLGTLAQQMLPVTPAPDATPPAAAPAAPDAPASPVTACRVESTEAVGAFVAAQRAAHPTGLSVWQWSEALLHHAAVVDLSVAAKGGPGCRAAMRALGDAVLRGQPLPTAVLLWLAELQGDAAMDAATLGGSYLETPSKGAPTEGGHGDAWHACLALLARASVDVDGRLHEGRVQAVDDAQPVAKRPRTAVWLTSPLGIDLRMHWLSSQLWAHADDTQAALHDLERCAEALKEAERQGGGGALVLPHVCHGGCIDAASLTQRLESTAT